MKVFKKLDMQKHLKETLHSSTIPVIGDPPSLLNTKCANWTDVVVVDGKCYDKDAVAKLLAERDALAATLSEIQQASQDYSDGKITRYEFVKKLAFLAAVQPQQHLAEIRAEAARAGFIAGREYGLIDKHKDVMRTVIERSANQYVESIRKGGDIWIWFAIQHPSNSPLIPMYQSIGLVIIYLYALGVRNLHTILISSNPTNQLSNAKGVTYEHILKYSSRYLVGSNNGLFCTNTALPNPWDVC